MSRYSAMSDLKNSYYLDGIMRTTKATHLKMVEAVRNSMAFITNSVQGTTALSSSFDAVKDLAA